MTRTLITGAAGFTGRHLTRFLAERGHEVHAVVHVPPEQPIEGVSHVHQADLADLASMRRIAADVRPQKVAHLAAIAFVAHEDVADLYRSNIVGTRQLLEALAGLSERPTAVLIASSANVYGNGCEPVLSESMPAAPANDYGISKAAVEQVARLYCDRLPIIVARPFNYTGPGQSTKFIIPKIIAHARDRCPVIEIGNLNVSRDFSDVRVVTDAYARLLEEPTAIGQTLNVCSGHAVSLQTIIDHVQALSRHKFEVKVNPAFVRANEVHSLCGSTARIEATIGPLKRIPLEETLQWMLEG